MHRSMTTGIKICRGKGLDMGVGNMMREMLIMVMGVKEGRGIVVMEKRRNQIMRG